jgi:hypothetical protein
VFRFSAAEVHHFSTQHSCHGAYNTDAITSVQSMTAQLHASQDFRTIRNLRYDKTRASPEMLSNLDPKCNAHCATITYDVDVLIPKVFRDFLTALHIEMHRPVHVEKQLCVQDTGNVIQMTSVSDYVLRGLRVHTRNTFPDTKTMHSVFDLHVTVPWYAALVRSKILEHLRQTLIRADNDLSFSLCTTGVQCRHNTNLRQFHDRMGK